LASKFIIDDWGRVNSLRRALKPLGKHGDGARQHTADRGTLLRRALFYSALLAAGAVLGYLYLDHGAATLAGLMVAGFFFVDLWRVKQAADLSLSVEVGGQGMKVSAGGEECLADTWQRLVLVDIQYEFGGDVLKIDSMTFRDSGGRQFTLVFSALPRSDSLLAECVHQLLKHGRLVAPIDPR
jgi:hypothetical protein